MDRGEYSEMFSTRRFVSRVRFEVDRVPRYVPYIASAKEHGTWLKRENASE